MEIIFPMSFPFNRNNKAFKDLEKHWYKILKESGFIDVEDTTRDDRPLKNYHKYIFNKMEISKVMSAQDYHYKAKELLLYHDFDCPIQKIVWMLHSEGLSILAIKKELENTDSPWGKDKIHRNLKKVASFLK